VYIHEFKAAQSCICWFEEKAVGKTHKSDLIWFSQLSITCSVWIDDGYSLLMICGIIFGPHKLLIS